jgi:hypothetical protein
MPTVRSPVRSAICISGSRRVGGGFVYYKGFMLGGNGVGRVGLLGFYVCMYDTFCCIMVF